MYLVNVTMRNRFGHNFDAHVAVEQNPRWNCTSDRDILDAAKAAAECHYPESAFRHATIDPTGILTTVGAVCTERG